MSLIGAFIQFITPQATVFDQIATYLIHEFTDEVRETLFGFASNPIVGYEGGTLRKTYMFERR